MNRMKRDKSIFIAICITIFICISVIAYNFIQNGSKKMDEVEEAFEVLATRAADCKCLPGYIPSNRIKARVLGNQGEFITISSPTLVRYGTDNKWIEKTVDANFRATNQFFGSDPAPGLHKRVETVANTNETYFCLSLSDPGKRRSCY